MLERFFNFSPDMLAISQFSGSFTRLNLAWENIVGYTEAELTDRPFYNWIHPGDVQATQAEMTKLANGIPSVQFENRFRCRDGSYKWLAWTAFSVMEEGAVYSIARDVSDRKQIEGALQESETKKQVLWNALPELMFVVNREGVYLDCQANKDTDLIVPRDYLIGKQVKDILPAVVAEQVMGAIAQVLQTGQSQSFEYELFLNQVNRSYEARLVIYQTDQILAFVRDITERKRAEAELLRSERMNRILLNAIPNLLIRMTRDGTYLDFMPAKDFKTIMPSKAMLGKTLFDVMPLEVVQQRMHYVELALQTGTTQVYEYEFQMDGERYCEEAQIAVSGEDEVLVIIRDISDRKQIEAERDQAAATLKQREQELKTLVENIPDIIARYDRQLRHLYLNPAVEQVTGLSPQMFIGKTCQEMGLAERDVSQWQTILERVFQSGQAESREAEFLTPIGVRYYQTHCVPERAADGSVQSVLTIARDMTDLKQAERALQQLNQELDQRVQQRTIELQQANEQLQAEIQERQRVEVALRQSEERFRQIFQHAPIGMALADVQTQHFLEVNPALSQLLGYSASEITALKITDVTYSEDLARTQQYLNSSSRGEIESCRVEKRYIKKNGDVLWASLTATTLRDSDGQPCYGLGMIEDISERKQAEAEILKSLEQARELNELKSQFITMVSHEFRTPLSTILSSTELLQTYGYQWAEERRQLRYRRIIEAIDRMTELLNHVLIVGKAEAGKLAFQPAPIELASFCHELLEELQLTLQEKHTLRFTYEGSSSALCLDAQLLRHVLVNLISNAIKYSPEGGEVHLKAIEQGEKAIFQIQDAGIGIPDEDQEQLFTLFKRGSNVGTISGTGLGLAIVKQCIDLHQGNVLIESQLGIGTLVTVSLPSARSLERYEDSRN